MPKAKRGHPDSREDSVDRNPELIQAAINEGMAYIAENHPELAKAGDYIGRHVDQRKLRERVRTIQGFLQKNASDWSDEERAKFMYENLAGYVAAGEIFDDSARRVILEGGLEKKTEREGSWWTGRGQKHSEKSDNLQQVTGAFRDLYDIMRSGDYAERMPELYKSVAQMQDLGFMKTAIEVLRSRDLLTEGNYNALNRAIEKRVQETSDRATTLMSEYISPKQKEEEEIGEREERGERREGAQFPRRGYKGRAIAAAIIGVVGLGLVLASNIRLTGNVLGTTAANTAVGFGGLLLVIAALTLAAFNRTSEGI